MPTKPARTTARTSRPRVIEHEAVPAGAKQPTDHEPPAGEVAEIEPMDYEITVKGITVTVPGDALDDAELLNDIALVDAGEDPQRVFTALNRLIGKQETNRVLRELRGERGRLPVEEAAEYISEVFGAINPS